MTDEVKKPDPGAPARPDPQRADRTVFRPAEPPAPGAPRAVPPADATRVRRPAPAPQDATRFRPPPAATRVRAPASAGAPAPVKDPAEHQRVLKGRFTLDKVIGVGGMGIVYKATDRLKVEAHDREPHVAIKVLSEEFKSHPESFIALQRESRKTQRIAHPNVVKVFDFDRDGDTVFMTMEYMEGVPLDQLIKQYSATGLPRDEVWNILNGLCAALSHAHADKIVHSDFKPGNVFITDAGVPKIFDFGIARAVANVDRLTGKSADRTVFDAGSLGALTPAYASMEMLRGEQPDTRDDVFALGCIAYEMLTGEHPYNRVPADEACALGMRPRRIPGIKKRQWRAIEQSLAFRREDRLATADEFQRLIQPKVRRTSIVIPTVLVILAIAAAAYYIVASTPAAPQQTPIHADDLAFSIRYDLFQTRIQALVDEPTYSAVWEASLWEEVSGMRDLLGGAPDEWLTGAVSTIYRLYISGAEQALAGRRLEQARALLDNVGRYAGATDEVDRLKAELARLTQDHARRAQAAADAARRAQEAREAREREEAAQRRAEEERRRTDAERQRTFEAALRNVNQQLQCQTQLRMREFSIAIDQLRAVDAARYAAAESTIVTGLAQCISHIGRAHPESALEAKTYALRIFPDNRVIGEIDIAQRDACDRSIAGQGARGERNTCRDRLASGAAGPILVVVPGNARMPMFAIGKYETTVRELNHYCTATQACAPLADMDDNLPAVGIPVATAIGYTRWLSNTTQQRYRLPTQEEWEHAAHADGSPHDANRNCQLSTRGFDKGGRIVRAGSGVQNRWGLVNYLGNAREWAYDSGRNLVAMGGSFEDHMDQCTVSSAAAHSGQADRVTGFRVVREVATR